MSMHIVPQGAAATNGADGTIQSDPIEPPDDLTDGERAVWEQYAPLALAIGQLTPERVPGFRDLCEAVDTYRALKKRIDSDGWTFEKEKVTIDGSGQEHREVEDKRHTLWPQLQFWALRRQQAMREFCLTGNGRPATSGAPPANPWSTI